MGILTAGFLKMYTKKLQLQLQNQLTRVTLQHNKIQKQIANQERMVNQMEQRQNSIFNAGLQVANWNAYNTAFAVDPTTNQSTIDANDANAMQAASSQYQMMQQKNAVLAQQAKLYQENVFEQFRTMQLEPLQQLEETLAMEKASLETRLATVKEQYDAAKQMEKDSIKDVTPDYTGQG